MGIILLAYLLPIIGIFIIAYLVFLRRAQSKIVYESFCIMLVLLILWMATQLISLLVSDNIALLALRASFVFSSFMLPMLVLFVAVYPATKKLPNPAILFTIFLPAIVFSLLCTSPLVYVHVMNNGLHQTIKTGLLYDIQGLYLLVYAFLAVGILAKKIPGLKNNAKQGVIGLLTSFAIPVIINVVANYVLKLDQSLVQYFWPISFFLMTALIAYSMIRHGLFDIKLAFVRSAAYGLALVTLAAIYYFIAYIISITLFQGEVSTAVSISPINILLALILAFIFQPIKNFFDKITNDIFFRDRYRSDEFYARLSEVLTTTTDLRSLLERAAREIGLTLKSEQTFFFVQYNHVHRVTAGTNHHSNLPIADIHQLNEYITKQGSDVMVADLLTDDHTIRRLLNSHKIALLMPLMRGAKIIGYLALGDQRSSGYTSRDIKVLQTISDELIIAIQNALSVQEVKDINLNLEQRIDAATKELRASNTQLRHLDTTKDEFLSMASHQLRTPLTSVKGYLSMVLEGDAGTITDAQKHLLSEAFMSSERMVHLIHDFLNVSRLQTGKFTLEKRPIDLKKLVHNEVESLKHVAETRHMKLKLESSGTLPLLNIDENKIQQVVMNYIDNALFYSHENTVIDVQLEATADQVELRVVDTGIGVPINEQAHLFTKFYRASNARKQRPDGTGVGLYLAKKVIVAHGGEVLFTTKEGQGSMFGFRLPLVKLQVEPSDE